MTLIVTVSKESSSKLSSVWVLISRARLIGHLVEAEQPVCRQ